MARGDMVDVESFLQRPLVARVATAGPTLRSVWFLWEESVLWWITDEHAELTRRVRAGERSVVVVVDSCDLATGEVIAVTIRGDVEIVPLDKDRAVRKFTKYLGPDIGAWDPALRGALEVATTRLARLVPERITATDMSFTPSC